MDKRYRVYLSKRGEDEAGSGLMGKGLCEKNLLTARYPFTTDGAQNGLVKQRWFLVRFTCFVCSR